jgi:sulfate adenylyltransferase
MNRVEVSPPNGGHPVERVLEGEARSQAIARSASLPALDLEERQAREVENLAMGIYAPLSGFLARADFASVLERGRFADGAPWTIPIVLDTSADDARRLGGAPEVLLRFAGQPLAILTLEGGYGWSRDDFNRSIFGTLDPAHPGVAFTAGMGPVLLAGGIDLIEPAPSPFSAHRLSPRATRARFAQLGWKTVVGFQTRNIPHIAHEALQKAALNLVDGLFINPLVGGKKAGDFEDTVIVAAYEALLRHYYPADRAALGILQGQMRYAGPREAIFHAIQRRNFGCTHFIVGRDHAGVGKFYPPYAAQEIFADYPDLGITPLFFGAFFQCRRCGAPASEKTCPHGAGERLDFSGTRVRDAILKGEAIDAMIRPEVQAAIRAVEGGPFRQPAG